MKWRSIVPRATTFASKEGRIVRPLHTFCWRCVIVVLHTQSYPLHGWEYHPSHWNPPQKVFFCIYQAQWPNVGENVHHPWAKVIGTVEDWGAPPAIICGFYVRGPTNGFNLPVEASCENMVEKRKNHEESRRDVAQNCKSDPDAVTVSISPAITNLIKFRWTSFLRGLDGNSWQVFKSKICLSNLGRRNDVPGTPGHGQWTCVLCHGPRGRREFRGSIDIQNIQKVGKLWRIGPSKVGKIIDEKCKTNVSKRADIESVHCISRMLVILKGVRFRVDELIFCEKSASAFKTWIEYLQGYVQVQIFYSN